MIQTWLRTVALALVISPLAALVGNEMPGDGIEPLPERRGWMEIGWDTAVLGAVSNTNNYLLLPQTLSLSWIPATDPGGTGWQVHRHWQLCLVVEPLVDSPESLYTALGFGRRFQYRKADSPWALELTGRFGAGWIDSTDIPDTQGQDFTFVTMVVAGIRYQAGDSWNFFLGGMYHHLSNAGLSEPERKNTGLDAFGPTFAIGFRF